MSIFRKKVAPVSLTPAAPTALTPSPLRQLLLVTLAEMKQELPPAGQLLLPGLISWLKVVEESRLEAMADLVREFSQKMDRAIGIEPPVPPVAVIE